ncbi:hypothetical protein GOBAR_DD23372 [Gossypium barbadense]|nr:hypothetical protein GOBAR_DD23372 [Gossypium barbadense]
MKNDETVDSEFEPFNGNDGDFLESNFAPCSTMEGMKGIASEVMIHNLDPNKHTTVIFKENKDSKIDSNDKGNNGIIVEKAVVR